MRRSAAPSSGCGRPSFRPRIPEPATLARKVAAPLWETQNLGISPRQWILGREAYGSKGRSAQRGLARTREALLLPPAARDVVPRARIRRDEVQVRAELV